MTEILLSPRLTHTNQKILLIITPSVSKEINVLQVSYIFAIFL